MSKPSLKVVRNEAKQMAEIFLYGIIGDYWYNEDPLTARKFQQQLALLSDVQTIHIRINSPGGDVHEGLGICNAILSSKKDIHCWNDGLAASMGAVILCSAKDGNRHAAKGSLTMMHSASTIVWGNSKELREQADTLDKYDEVLAEFIADAAGLTVEQVVSQWMDGKDHWLTAKEAEEAGLVTIEDYKTQDVPENATSMSLDKVAAFYGKNINPTPQIKNENMFGTNKFKALNALAKVVDAGSITPEQVKAVNDEIEAENIPGVTLVLDSTLQTVTDQAEKVPALETQVTDLGTQVTNLTTEKTTLTQKVTDLEKTVADQKVALGKPAEEVTAPVTEVTDSTGKKPVVVDNFETSFDREVRAARS